MADKPLVYVHGPNGTTGFEDSAKAADWAQKTGGRILSPKEAAPYQTDYETQGWTGSLTAGALNAGFGIGKLGLAALGTPEQQAWGAAAERNNPGSAFLGSFIAPWGAAGKVAGGLARGLVGAGEAVEAGSIFGRASILGEELGAKGAGELAAGESAARSLAPVIEETGALARPGFAQEAGALAGRPLTAEGAAIVEAHPRSFLEAAVREGGLNAGVGAINSAGDYLLAEKYMDGDPNRDAGSLTQAILSGALTGGLLGGAAGVVTHGAGKAVDALLNPANAPKMRVPEAIRGELEASLRKGGLSAAEAAKVATNAIEHGLAGTATDAASYNAVSAMLENARIKRALERGEIQLPPSMAGETDLKNFVDEVAKKAHAVRAGKELPSSVEALRSVEGDVTKAATERRSAVLSEARLAPSPEGTKVWVQNGYKGELKGAAAELADVEATEAARLVDRAHAMLERSPTSRTTRIMALDLMDRAMAHAPEGFHLEGERAVLAMPLEHAANGPKFLSALGEHQLAEKARRDLGKLVGEAKVGGAISQDTVSGVEQAMKSLGLEGGRVDKALVEHYQNTAAQAIGAESKQLSAPLRMLGGLMAGGLASKVLGGFAGGAMGLKVAQSLGQAAADPIAASGTIRKAMVQLRHGAADIERIVQGLQPNAAPKASVMNVIENMTPWGKLLWDTAPGKTARAIGQTLEDGFRAMAPSMPQRAAAGMQAAQSIEAHLEKHEPKPVVPINVNPAAMANMPPRYNDREVAAYQTRLQATVNPTAVIANFFKTGELTKEAADTLRATHPYLVRDVVARGAAQMAKAPEADRPAMARQLEVLAGPRGGYFSASSTPGFVAAVQKGYAEMQPQGTGPGGPSGNASPQKKPGPGGAQFAPVSVTRNMNGKFLQTTHAAPSAALSTNLGSQ
jgi:hypothetical protein